MFIMHDVTVIYDYLLIYKETSDETKNKQLFYFFRIYLYLLFFLRVSSSCFAYTLTYITKQSLVISYFLFKSFFLTSTFRCVYKMDSLTLSNSNSILFMSLIFSSESDASILYQTWSMVLKRGWYSKYLQKTHKPKTQTKTKNTVCQSWSVRV